MQEYISQSMYKHKERQLQMQAKNKESIDARLTSQVHLACQGSDWMQSHLPTKSPHCCRQLAEPSASEPRAETIQTCSNPNPCTKMTRQRKTFVHSSCIRTYGCFTRLPKQVSHPPMNTYLAGGKQFTTRVLVPDATSKVHLQCCSES